MSTTWLYIIGGDLRNGPDSVDIGVFDYISLYLLKMLVIFLFYENNNTLLLLLFDGSNGFDEVFKNLLLTMNTCGRLHRKGVKTIINGKCCKDGKEVPNFRNKCQDSIRLFESAIGMLGS